MDRNNEKKHLEEGIDTEISDNLKTEKLCTEILQQLKTLNLTNKEILRVLIDKFETKLPL